MVAHSHEVGDGNSHFTRLGKEARQEIERLLRLGVEPRKVGNIFTEENLLNLWEEGSKRSQFCTRSDVWQIENLFSNEGMPAAWMILSNATEDTIKYFLNLIRAQNPGILPEYFMSNKDHAQINAIRAAYHELTVLLCWWHILHAWQQHFVITSFPKLWKQLKKWVRITDCNEFWAAWEEIKKEAPESVISYLKTYWLNDIKLWSAVYRQDQNIFQLCDTNMLIEAWHHLLKGTFMQGKQNRRLDQLIHTLINVAIPHFIHRHHRQLHGFEGPDLEVKKMLEIELRAKSVAEHLITPCLDEPDVYVVKSASKAEVEYCVDLDAYDCTCLFFSAISFCKHICAVQTLFPEKYDPIPTSALMIHSDHSIEPTPTLNLSLDGQNSPLKDDEINVITQKLLTLLLPQPVQIAPNLHSWTETAHVMGVPVKSNRGQSKFGKVPLPVENAKLITLIN
ncbi:hypothetical protein HYPSUDRAFT_72880 [Hypholoma sublateritium FD-334 SS-4]|uniref:SWIM-type domain-containing protein n=1 Tax=Hypholoma sublateritium (strain FD-334 SS-4) TaxID=945553 RepID=A0A0D2KGU6_HYPSF|nr:hypothetical protein HYPSUDRAFT_72880 [Hypholoma sublateritium FD-334 SS-4]